MSEEELEIEEQTGAQPPRPETDDTSWDAAMANLRQRYPKASSGILFCVFKLQQNPHLTIPDFRDEAALHGITLGGRALHSAKVLLGLEKPSVRKPSSPKPEPVDDERPRRASQKIELPQDLDVEQSLIAVVKQIQEAGTAEANRLRTAMRDAIAVLQRALDGRGAG